MSYPTYEDELAAQQPDSAMSSKKTDVPQTTTACPWCKTDGVAALARYEGPHATWCVHYREGQLRAALEAVQAEILLDGHLGEIVESALHG